MGGERAPKELRHAVRAGNLELVKKHVAGGKYTDAISNPKVGSTILFASAQVSFVRLCACRLILSLSPSRPPLTATSWPGRRLQCGHAKVAKHLIDSGADVNTSIKSGASALYTACFRVRGCSLAPSAPRVSDHRCLDDAGPHGGDRGAVGAWCRRESGQVGRRHATLRCSTAVSPVPSLAGCPAPAAAAAARTVPDELAALLPTSETSRRSQSC
jgi:hypothetical protein